MLKEILEISCKLATFLASKKEAGKTSIFENLKLKLHYNICNSCRLFDKQITFIGKNAKHTHNHKHIAISPERKQAIKDMIKSARIIILMMLSAV